MVSRVRVSYRREDKTAETAHGIETLEDGGEDEHLQGESRISDEHKASK